MKRLRIFLYFFLGCLLPGMTLSEDAKRNSDFPPGQGEGDWLEFYYRDPKPGEFMGQMEAWARDGTLKNFDSQPILIAFISQLMRQNRQKVQQWWLDLKSFSKEDRVVYGMALLFARIDEADAIIADAMGQNHSEFERPPKILELPLDKVSTVPMLWGYFYATGSKSAIRRLVLAFRYELMPEKPEGVKIPEGYKPFYTELPQMVHSSMISNLERHPHLIEICEDLFRNDETLHAIEKENLYDLLSEIKPDSYPPRLQPDPVSPGE